ncbi:zinc ribbon-containing protein [Salinilacihabitans rarus]|uniref:zinc ribbon-containing protein n=1 Tax=Salinilacihabitans rarus TaxID=2961596 RepID=UPI0020C8EFF5|nr:zinc ribbon-containing protein [Salinilacihabitans rarus]
MSGESATVGRSRCLNCGFEAPSGDDAWLRLDVPGLGRMTQCPECNSTNIITGR